MKPRTNLYEELGLDVNASAADIDAAYERLLQHLSSGEHGLSPEHAGRRINLLKHAYWTLSNTERRAGYDAALASSDNGIQFAVEIREPRWTPQKILLIVIGGLIALGMVIQIALNLYSHYRVRQLMENPPGLAEERAQAEEDKRAAEERRRVREAEEAERKQEREIQEAERKRERELEENRRYADQVSRDLRRAEEQAKREADSEQRRAEQEERARQEAERRRIEQQKYMWQQQLRRY